MRLAFWAAWFAAGILVGIAAGSLAIWLMAGATLLAVFLWKRLGAVHLAVAGLAFACGIGLGHREILVATAEPAFAENADLMIRGEVVAGADVAAAASPVADALSDGGDESQPASRCHLRIRVCRIGDTAVDVLLSLLVLAGDPATAPGDVVEFPARVFVPHGFANPELPPARLLARAQGTDVLATVRSADAIRVVGRTDGPFAWLRRWAFLLRRAMADVINRRISEPSAGFVRTMVLGERNDVPTKVEDGFRAAGATHVLSVSGLHLAVVVALFFQTLRRIFAALPALSLRVPPKVVASLLSLPACAFYALLTGEAVATLRSAVMASIVLLASIVNRPLCLATSIAAAAFLLLARSPLAILDVSFQLSFASVIGLGLFARWMLPGHGAAARGPVKRTLAWLRRSLSASVAACLVTAPLVAHHFGEITPAAPLGNLVLVPIVELVVLPCGLIGALLGLAHSWLGALPLWLAAFASQTALAAADLFRRFAPVVLVRYPTWGETLLLVAGAGLCLVAFMRRSARPWLVLGAVAGLCACASMVVRDVLRRGRDDVRVTFLDVGQGDAAIVEGPHGFVALVDGGGRYDDSFDTGARIVEPILRTRGIGSLDLVILSHPHPDHMNGLFRILQRFPVRTLWTSGDDGQNRRYAELIALARQRGVRLDPPTDVRVGGVALKLLGPWFDGAIGVPPGLGTNDGSLVVQLVFAGRRILLAGDIGSEGEEELFEPASGKIDVASEVLKVPHHGSRYASSDRFLAAVSPVLAVASAGRFNRFGLPNPAAIRRYERRNIPLLRTDRNGAVRVTVDNSGRITTICALGCGR
jgi:competence protein ComEC